ncbi:MAG TPA: glycosyltransferase family 4 protein [Myxococcota bacterium]|nr:glycosyltransferase family 4 protein [Myxococcota bacterium]HQK50851.1 glycosyltransferase family 4 protein [Myxococcota bacterium]
MDSTFSPRRRILFLTDLDVWLLQEGGAAVERAGNQSLYNTLLGYAQAGWQVDVLTSREVHGALDHLPGGIRIHRAPLVLQGSVRALRRWRDRLRPPPAPPPAAPRTRLDPMALENRGRFLAFQAQMTLLALRQCLPRPPDVLYGYEIFGAPIAAWLGRRLGVASVNRFQGTLLSAWIDDPAVFDALWMNRLALTAPADLIVMADDGTRGDEVLARLGVPRDRVRFWINGVVKEDIEAARRRIQAPRDGVLRLLTASRLVEWKRVDRVLRLVARLPRDLPPWRLHIAGDGPERRALEGLAGDLGLQGRVVFEGPLAHDRVLDLLVQSEGYLSLYDLSNLSNGVLEAMVAGVPVFTLDVGGTSHVVRPGESGVLLAPRDLDREGPGLLARWIRDASWRRALAEGAARTGWSLRTWEERMRLEVQEVEALIRRRARS